MELKIGEKIAELRRGKGITQEQLAEALGVSAPAVSKWETDRSYPDIMLLCPLAKALGTDVDFLLSFEEELSEERLGVCMEEIVGLEREGHLAEAEEKVNGLLRDYPSSIPLKFQVTAVLSIFEMTDSGSGEDRERWRKKKKELCQAVLDSGDPAFYLQAVSMLVSLELADGRLEKAEELLRENRTAGDFTSLWIQLYRKKGEREKALETAQRQLYELVGKVQTCLMSMLGEEFATDPERTEEICNVLRKVSRIFRVGGCMEAGVFAEVSLRQGEREKALEYLEELTDRVTSPAMPPNPLLFRPGVSPEPEKLEVSRELRLAILRALETDEALEPMREEMRFQALVYRLRRSLEA
ncbi:MAG: helix-turn-helix domain-containing protein [Roseburia sp.]|nr:helix-turn-helix domain-containing protein [Roseburia sp.]MCM1099072.1 helix-turn-helix domain-containing protein [Ruminococcus flavefaciens]